MPATATDSYSNLGLVPVADHGMKSESLSIKLINSVTYPKGTVLGQITAGGLFKAYASGSADGSQNPRGLLGYDCVVDGSGNITIGGGSQGEKYLTAPMFTAGDFNAADCVGLDATALTNSRWISLIGDLTTGIIRLPG